VKEMERACRKAGLKFGVYVSPWGRHDPDYASPKYVEKYHAQIKELLSGDYGEIFEMWFGISGGLATRWACLIRTHAPRFAPPVAPQMFLSTGGTPVAPVVNPAKRGLSVVCPFPDDFWYNTPWRREEVRANAKRKSERKLIRWTESLRSCRAST